MIALAALLSAVAAAGGAAAPRPPETRRGDVVDDYFGTKVPDPYRWLEDDRSAETAAWVAAQNEASRAFLDAIPERAAIARRLTRLMDVERGNSPVRRGGRLFSLRNTGLLPQPQLVVDDGRGAPRVLLDPGALSADGTTSLADFAPSADGELVAYALSEAGSDWVSWRVRRVSDGQDLPDVLRWSKFSPAAWLEDGKGFFYGRFDAPPEGAALTAVNQGHQIWFHRLGTAQEEDRLVYRRTDQPEWNFAPAVTRGGRYLVVTASKGTNPETAVFLADLSRAEWKVEPLLDRMDAAWELCGNLGDDLYFVTDQGAPRRRLVALRPGGDPAPRPVLPEGPGRDVLDAAAVAGGRLVVQWSRDARAVLEVFSAEGRRMRAVPLPALGSVLQLSGDPGDPDAFFTFTGFTQPPAVFRLPVAGGRAAPVRRPRLPFDPARFVTRQVFYRSKDGTRVPMFLVQRRGLARDGRLPTLLYGYGGFQQSMTPHFSAQRLAWAEMGGLVAIPNLRGGNEYGRAWYDAGRLDRKQNVFDDFVAAAEWLVARGLTRPTRLAINGGSNGGLLVGAVMTQRPDLFGAAVPEVGVMDMLRFHKFTIGWAWTSDYGSSDTPEGFEVLYRYSPLHRIRPAARYPATLVLTADHDDRVVPAHSHKFTAALQAAQAGEAPVLARIETRAGHGAGAPTQKRIEERADVLAFLVRVLGVRVPPGFGGPAAAGR